jgi:hypothetical protein
MAETAQPAIAAAGAIVKARLQAGIFADGLGSGFVKALRVEFYPKRNNSTDATAPVHHKIPDACVFKGARPSRATHAHGSRCSVHRSVWVASP